MILEINGQEVEVDDSFDKLTPEQQNATVDEIALSLGAEPAEKPSETQLGADRRMADDAAVAEQTAAGRQEAYDQKPWYSQALQAGQDVGRLLENGATMGFGDKMRAVSSPSQEEGWLNKTKAALNVLNPGAAVGDMLVKSALGDDQFEKNLAKERDQTQAARDRARNAALPAEIAGAVMSGSTLANSGATLAGRVNTAKMPAWLGVPTRAAVIAPEGAVYGAVDAVGNDKDVTTGAITGAIAAPIGSVVGDAVSKVASKVLPAKTASSVPTPEKLKQEAKDAYTAADEAGVVITPQTVNRLRENVQKKLTDFGYHPQNQPGAKVALEEIDRIAQGNVTLKGMDTLRQITRGGYTPTNPKNNAAIEIVVDEIDDLMKGLKSHDVVMGDVDKGVKSLKDARELWTRVRKYERFSDAVESAKLRAASTGSGGNVENATRQELRRFIDPKIKTAPKNWTDAEAEALNDIVRGTVGQNTLRLIGKLSPSGNGLNLLLHLGGATWSGGATIPFAAAGMGAKYMADRGVRKGVEALDELMRAGGSKEALKKAQATLRMLSQAQREAVARLIQMTAIQSEVGQQEPAQ